MALITGSSSAAWGSGRPLGRKASGSAHVAEIRDRPARTVWDRAEKRERVARVVAQTARIADRPVRVVWGLRERADAPSWRVYVGTARPGMERAATVLWGLRVRADGRVWRVPVGTARPGMERAATVVWNLRQRVDGRVWSLRAGLGTPTDRALRLPWGLARRVDYAGGHVAYVVIGDPPGTVWPTPPVFVDGQRWYYMVNSISAVSLRSGAFLKLDSVSMRLDIGSWAWSLSAALSDRASLLEVAPDEDGPAQMDVTVNGYTWRMMVEQYQDARQFARGSWSLTGRGTQSLLAAPYSMARSYEESAELSAVQLAEQEVAHTGATLTWSTVDWTVPPGVWSYQDSTPMDALTRLAAASGAVILPDRTSDDLTIRPRYLVSPWEWAAATPVATLPASLIGQLGLQYKPAPAYNGVWVSGRDQGVLVHVKRTGTDGGDAAPMVVDPLILAVNVATERGRNILAASGNKAEVTFDLPLLPSPTAPGLLLPGQLIEILDPAGTWRGMVTSVSVSARGVGVTQTVTVERHY
jgi:hypothetical protein